MPFLPLEIDSGILPLRDATARSRSVWARMERAGAIIFARPSTFCATTVRWCDVNCSRSWIDSFRFTNRRQRSTPVCLAEASWIGGQQGLVRLPGCHMEGRHASCFN